MSKMMLIDAAHAEETRVVVTDNGRVEEFDFESQARKQLRGNIYLAKVTRVEPSLQAAFIEYGGNRHGFLAFNEIHPDYYQIPLADREALMRDLAEDHHDDAHDEPRANGEEGEENGDAVDTDDDVVEEELERRRRRLMRKYKIQEVIKRRQIMLVQVVKEERGNKGAALTTYLSLAGRYGVLMPNTARGGGISRKITTATDRKRLKTIVQGLDVPSGMGLIIRTAGAKRTKTEIQRDYEYLMRAWENIRETTMHSIAPALIYAEEDLVKRAIRDMFDKDIDQVLVEGDKGYKDARDFMRMLMPAQAKKISQHKDPTPLFVKHRVEDHLSQIYSPVVPLRSGGYLVINQTEALVAIDVNSGKSTRERNIEATALKTNLEAAEEACRQLRLRDLAGLIVIDFIDMDEPKNNRAVEKKLKDGLALDRARVQMGKISMFGLMEISRQRRRTGVLEGTTHVCEHCGGTGRVRTAESSALSALRAVELEAVKGGAGSVTLRVPRGVGLYILNEKRGYLERLNQTLGLFVTVLIDDAVAHSEHAIERTSHTEGFRPPVEDAAAQEEEDTFVPPDDEDEDYEDEEEDEDDGDEDSHAEASGEDRQHRDGEGRRGRGRRRRRGGRGRDDDHRGHRAAGDDADDEDREEGEDGRHRAEGERDGDREGRRRRRRGRRGGRRTREEFRTDDPYAWARMRAPDGDPYVWLDPADVLSGGAAPQPANDAAPGPRSDTAPLAGETDMWVELPPREEREGGRRNRRGRGRGRGRDRDDRRHEEDRARPQAEDAAPETMAAEAEHVIGPAVEDAPAAEPAPAEADAPKPKGRGRGKKAQVSLEASPHAESADDPAPVARKGRGKAAAQPAPEPVAAEPAAPEPPAPEPVAAEPAAPPAPPEPDPNEISAPPAQPKRGWWRRG